MNITKLKAAGVDYNEGLKRYANRPQLYGRFLVEFFENPIFQDLQESLKQCDYKKAFACAHTLKGMSGNLSFTKLYSCICELVELLREHPEDHREEITKRYEEVEQLYHQIESIIVI